MQVTVDAERPLMPRSEQIECLRDRADGAYSFGMTRQKASGVRISAVGVALLVGWLLWTLADVGGMYIAAALFVVGVFAVLLGIAVLVTAAVQTRRSG